MKTEQRILKDIIDQFGEAQTSLVSRCCKADVLVTPDNTIKYTCLNCGKPCIARKWRLSK